MFGLDLSFGIRRLGLYRTDITIRNRTGKRLARYGEYLRAVGRRHNARLVVDRTSFKPGESVVPRLENHGTAYLSFGLLGAYYQHLEHGQWVGSSFGNGPALAIGLGSGPGMSVACWERRIPDDAPPGRYRFNLQVGHSFSHPGARRNRRTLSVEFEIAP